MKPRHYLIALVLSLVSLSAYSDSDNKRARELHLRGEIVSLESLLPTIRQYGDWPILEIELEQKHDVLLYEIELLDDQGRVQKLRFDAKTGKEIKRAKK
ncbi:MAG: hypothetical protein IBX57_05260 [Gammaproteobacteria bacterium]|nr:hypothetical protein [Gammaproteobacteria bacterium]